MPEVRRSSMMIRARCGVRQCSEWEEANEQGRQAKGSGDTKRRTLHWGFGCTTAHLFGSYTRGSTTMTVRVREQLLRYGIGGYEGESDQFSAVAGQQRV